MHEAGCTITLIRNSNNRPLSKSFSLREGKLVKSAAADLVEGTAKRVSITSLPHLSQIIGGLRHNGALVFGVCAYQNAAVTTQKRLSTLPAASGTLPFVCRDRAHFRWPTGPGVLMLDIDKPKDDSAPMTAKTFDALLCTLLPWWSACGRFYRPSASAFISDTAGNILTGNGSLRGYAIVDRAEDIPFVGVSIADTLWRAGYGRIEFSAAGSALPRCPVDTAVWQPERLDFAGPSIIGPGLVQRRYPAYIIDGGMITSETVIAAGPGRVTVAEWMSFSAEVRRAKQVSRPEEQTRRRSYVSRHIADEVSKGSDAASAKRRWSNAVYGSKLGKTFPIVLRDGRVVQVADILKAPAEFNQIRCRDPLDPQYADDGRIAIICAVDNGAMIYSHAHGGVKYTLEMR